MKIFHLKPEAAICTCDTHNRWYIRTYGKPAEIWSNAGFSWDTCPGSLYQEYESEKEAQVVALWWGFQIVDARQRTLNRVIDLIGMVLLCFGLGMVLWALLP